MKILRKKILIWISGIAFVLLCATGAFLLKDIGKAQAQSADYFISSRNSVSIQLESETPDSIGEARKGVKVTVDSTPGVLEMKGNKGPFDLKFRALSTQPGTAEISQIRFDFTDTLDEKKSFRFVMAPSEVANKDGTVSHSVRLESFYTEVGNIMVLYQNPRENSTAIMGNDGTKHLVLNNANLVGLAGQTLGVSFDPFEMKLKVHEGENVVEVVDFDNPDSMQKNFATRDTLSAIREYDVKMTVITAAQNASLLLYEYNGESLAGKTVENTVGPVLDSRLNDGKGVVGVEYDLNLSSVYAFDGIDGYASFKGEVAVTAPDGAAVPCENGKFLPTVAGSYTVKFTPKDSAGIAGESYSHKIYVLEEYPANDFRLHYDISSELVFNGKAKLPSMTFASALAGKYDEKCKVSAKVFEGEKVFFTQEDASKDFVVDVGGKTNVGVRYYATDGLGKERVSKLYTLTDNGGKGEIPSVASSYVNGSYAYAENVVIGGKNLRHELVSPSGRSSTFEKVLLDEVGQWQLRYYYEVAEKEYAYTQYFDCYETPSNLFKTERNMQLTDGVSTPSYFNIQRTGLQAVSATAYAAMTYKKPINVSGYQKDDVLFEFLVTPDAEGSGELQEITLLFADGQNAANDVKIVLGLSRYFDYYNVVATVFVGDKQVGGNHYRYHSTFYGKYDDRYFSNSIKITFDYAQKTLYIYNDYYHNRYLQTAIPLNDPKTVGNGNEWQGFTDGTCTLQYIYSKLLATSHSLILTVDGMSTAGSSVVDTAAPGISVNVEESNIPKAVVGSAFPIMQATAIDSIDGRIDDVTVKVYKMVGNALERVAVRADNSFVPDAAGRYKLIYAATDAAGNTAQKELVVEAFEQLETLTLAIDVDESYPDALRQGEIFKIVPSAAYGGSGTIRVEISLEKNGEKYPPEGIYVEAIAVGTYKVIYTLTDYVGSVRVIEKEIAVSRSEEPLFAEVTIPDAVIAGREFEVPTVQATWFENDVKKMAAATPLINGNPVEGNRYKPTEAGSFTLAYTVNGFTSASTTVQVLKLQTGAGYLAGYFHHDEKISVDVSETAQAASYMTFQVNGDSKLFFANKLGGYSFSINFLMDNATNHIGKIHFTLQDSVNPNEKIVLTTEKSELPDMTTGVLSVNGGTKTDLPGDYSLITSGGSLLRIVDKTIYGVNGVKIMDIETTAYGDAFNGFSSGYVYVSVAFEGVTAPSQFTLKSINNQNFSASIDKDKMAPELVLYEEYIPTAEKGDAYVFPKMQVFDTLDSTLVTEMTVTAPSGTVVYAGEIVSQYSFKIEEYGLYLVKLEYSDGNKRWAKYDNTISVMQNGDISVSYDGELPTKATLGKTVILPKATVEEGITVFVSVNRPDGVEQDLTGETELQLGQIGTYRIMYFAYNSEGSYHLDVFEIKVEGGQSK